MFFNSPPAASIGLKLSRYMKAPTNKKLSACGRGKGIFHLRARSFCFRAKGQRGKKSFRPAACSFSNFSSSKNLLIKARAVFVLSSDSIPIHKIGKKQLMPMRFSSDSERGIRG